MYLNMIKPVEGSKHVKRRLGRGIGSGLGKTSGRGHKGQKSRSGGFHKVGFEGGQMPLQRRLPKRGFNSISRFNTVEIRLADLAKIAVDQIDLSVLKQSGLVGQSSQSIKLILSGEYNKAVVLKGIKASKGAKLAIEACGGRVEE